MRSEQKTDYHLTDLCNCRYTTIWSQMPHAHTCKEGMHELSILDGYR